MTDFNAPGNNPEGRNIAVDKNKMASIIDSGLRTQDSGLRTQDSGLRTQDSGLRTQDSGLRSLTGRNYCSHHQEERQQFSQRQ